MGVSILGGLGDVWGVVADFGVSRSQVEGGVGQICGGEASVLCCGIGWIGWIIYLALLHRPRVL